MLTQLATALLTALTLSVNVAGTPLNARQATAARPTATVDSGSVIGTTTSIPSVGTANKYLGIPFARIPARFSPSVTITNFSGSFDASNYGFSCYQQFIPLVGQPLIKPLYNTPPPAAEGEDCLNVNIYTPANAGPASNLSVLFWLYGGSLQFGSNSIQIYDGSRISVLENVVVVSVNYRTNVFGFPAASEIPVTERNLGFLDQRRALDWCQQNIRTFGGDPNKITLVGESAGSYSIDALITSYNSSSSLPFRAAIMQSGLYSNDQRRRLTGSTASWESLAASFNCSGKGFSSNLTCLRAANATAIQLTIEKLGLAFNPTVDNVTAVANPAQKRRNRNIANVPLLIGTNANEGRVFSLGQSNLTAYASTLFPTQPALVSAVVAAYTTGTGYDQVSAATTDATFQCPTAALARDDAVAYPGNIYRYFYNATFPNLQVLIPLFGIDLGAFHASEIPQIYGTFPEYNTTTQQYALSRTMQSIWGSFIRNPQAGPGWPAYGTGAAASVPIGTGQIVSGGQYTNGNGTVLSGNYSVAVLGNRGNTVGSGVTIVDVSEIDRNCALYASLYP